MYKLICEELLKSMKMFDKDYLNIIVNLGIIYMAFPFAWIITNKISTRFSIVLKDKRSLTHWIFRIIVGILLFWTIKIPLIICILVQNKIIASVLFGVLLNFIICLLKYSYIAHKQYSSYNRFKRRKQWSSLY